MYYISLPYHNNTYELPNIEYILFDKLSTPKSGKVDLPSLENIDIPQFQPNYEIVPEQQPEQEQQQSRTVNSDTINNIINTALQQVGKPYVYGAPRYTGGSKVPKSFDCSSFCHFVYGINGINIPSSTAALLKDKRAMSVSLQDVKPGDLIVSSSSGSQSGRHVEMVSEVSYDAKGNPKIRTVHAKGKKYGVVEGAFNTKKRIRKILRYATAAKASNGCKLLPRYNSTKHLTLINRYG